MSGKSWRKAGVAAALSMLIAAPSGAFEMFGGDATSMDNAIEYYNAGFGEYVITSSADEIAALDAASASGWKRNGAGMAFYAINRPVAAFAEGGSLRFAAPVCRFFIPPASHFLSASADECAMLNQSNGVAVLESDAAFYVFLPDDNGRCPLLYTAVGAFESAPVYRLWNGVIAHRLTASKAERDAMVGDGWISEGYGVDGVSMCAPMPTGG